MPFGERLRELRRSKGLSQTQLAKAADVHLSTLCRLEQGAASDPSWTTVLALAKGLGVGVERFVPTASAV